ncbi:hypothetical protein YQE_09548, partial [Dendroctonus ponderosae]
MVTKPTILVPPSLSNSSCHHPRYQNVSIWSTISTGDVVQTAVVLALTFAILFANILLISVINSRRYAKYIHSQIQVCSTLKSSLLRQNLDILQDSMLSKRDLGID